jgi:hypothetical protein
VFHFDCNLLHGTLRRVSTNKSSGKKTSANGLSHGNQTVVTNVQLRLEPFVSNLSRSGSDDSNPHSVLAQREMEKRRFR